MSRSATVELPTGIQTTSETVAIASGATLQVCRTQLSRAPGSRVQITLLLDVEGTARPTAADLARIDDASGALGILATVRIPESGHAVVVTREAPAEPEEDIAMAAAVCAASWGWDESPRIHVVVNGREWDVAPSFRDGVWTATVE